MPLIYGKSFARAQARASSLQHTSLVFAELRLKLRVGVLATTRLLATTRFPAAVRHQHTRRKMAPGGQGKKDQVNKCTRDKTAARWLTLDRRSKPSPNKRQTLPYRAGHMVK